MRFSILQLLLLISFVALASVSLKFADHTWWMVLATVGLLGYLAIAVVALVGGGDHRSFAIGFIACCTVYGVFLFFFAADDPTSKLLAVMHESIASNDAPSPIATGTTGNVLDTDDAFQMMGVEVEVVLDASSGSSSFDAFGGAVLSNKPSRVYFMKIGHLWWAVLLGWIGGLFARWVHGRERETNSQHQRSG